MRIGATLSLSLLVAFASACATTLAPRGGPGSPVQLHVPAVLAWEPEGPYDIDMTVLNATNMAFTMVEAQPEATEVTVYRPDGTIACKTPAAVQKTYHIYAVGLLNSGAHWNIKRDLRKDCLDLSPGLYRYEASYRANTAETSGVYRAFLGPQGGQVLVRTGASSMTYDNILAAVDGTKPTDATDAGPDVVKEEPATATAPEPSPSAAEVHSCVDKELRDRGLNAYGDPDGATYANGTPPVDESGRILYVASRNPGIRRACKIPMF